MDYDFSKFSTAEIEYELKALQSQKNDLNKQIALIDTDIIGLKEELRRRTSEKQS